MATSVKALPTSTGGVKLPYLGAQVFAALGPTQTKLTERAIKHIKKTLPVPCEQDIIWADVTFGTRTHGLVVTGQGIFLKDGPSGEEDDDVDWSQDDGAGYHYLRWRNFDPSFISLHANKPCIAGIPCQDVEKFDTLARQCMRLAHGSDKLMEEASKALLEGKVKVARGVESIYRKSAALTYADCLKSLNSPGQTGTLRAVEVPFTQFDAVLERMRTAIKAGKIADCYDVRLAGVLVRKGAFTYRQAMNLAKAGHIRGLSYVALEDAVRYTGANGLSAAVLEWLSGRAAVRGLNEDQDVSLTGVAQAAAQAAGGIAAVTPKTEQDNVLSMTADTVISSAGRSVGVAGARAITGALGMATGPVGAIAGLALGNICGEAVPQAVNMAKGLFMEPAEQVLGRMFDAVVRNMVFEYAFTQAEQAVLGVFLRKVDPRAYQALLASLRKSETQEQDIRDFIEPAFEAVRTR